MKTDTDGTGYLLTEDVSAPEPLRVGRGEERKS
jgi:hypothetical protein